MGLAGRCSGGGSQETACTGGGCREREGVQDMVLRHNFIIFGTTNNKNAKMITSFSYKLHGESQECPATVLGPL